LKTSWIGTAWNTQLCQQSCSSKQEERAKGMMNLAFRNICVHTCTCFCMP
jgi:hypothetical protein